jgi:CO dehydrogenase maturation factor
MNKSLAVTGKGGCGKTTVAALMVRALVQAGQTPVLAVDADPNTNLDAALGVTVESTVGDIREEALQKVDQLAGGLTKTEFLRMRTQQSLVEAKGFDLLAMGRPEGPGCYCFANSILRGAMDQLSSNYARTVIDCEAGLEHLSRRTTRNLDDLVVLADPSLRSVETAARIVRLAGSLEVQIKNCHLVFSRVRNGLPEFLEEAARERGLEIRGIIPDDDEVRSLDEQGKPLVGVSADNPVFLAVMELLKATGWDSR